MLPIEIYSGFFNPRHACKWGGDYKGCVSHRYNEGESVRGAHGSRDFSKGCAPRGKNTGALKGPILGDHYKSLLYFDLYFDMCL